MEPTQITAVIAQVIGVVAMILIVLSFQIKSNRVFFLLQVSGGFLFFLNFILIGAFGGALFNLFNVVRGLLLMKDPHKLWKIWLIEGGYTVCFIISSLLNPDPWQIFLVGLTYVSLLVMSVLMWKGNSIHIRYGQLVCSSPAWIVHNIFNLSVGGLICEGFNMVSSVVYLIRMRQEGKKHD